MGYEKIQLQYVGDVCIIRLNDPSTLNGVSVHMFEELDAAVDEATTSARAMVLTGVGKAFCSGANLNADQSAFIVDGVFDAGAVVEKYANPLMEKLRRLPIPWISAVRGAAAGVGCSLALAADLIIAGESAFFLQAFVRIGLVPDGGSSWLLPRSIGRVRSMEMMLLGERIPATQALEWGLINRLTQDAMLEQVALDLAAKLATGPTESIAMIRELAWAAAEDTWEVALKRERQFQGLAGRTSDYEEGVSAFREKRDAKFTGGRMNPALATSKQNEFRQGK